MNSETPDQPDSLSNNIPAEAGAFPTPKKANQPRWTPSLVWLIPMIAALVGLFLMLKLFLDHGPTITVSFRTAEGLQAGKSKVKYKDVEIGEVKAIRLSNDRKTVLTTILLSKDAKGFSASDTSFWVVRPRVDATGITGFGTLLSGAYIGAEAGAADSTSNEFVGLELPPIVSRDATGKQFVLHAHDVGSLDIGSPVFYRQIKVGRVASYNLDENGKGVSIRIFVDTPYDRFIGLNTRFWHASGVNLELNSNGIKVNTMSLASLATGGLAFQSIDDETGEIAHENTEFELAENQTEAFKPADGNAETAILYFNQSLRGLSPGAPVEYRGVVVGKVKSIAVEYDALSQQFQMPVVVDIYPQRLGRNFDGSKQSTYTNKQWLKDLINSGLRAQLSTGSLLTGQLFVAIDIEPKASKLYITHNKKLLEIPTTAGSLNELQTQITKITDNLSKVPFDEIGNHLQKTLVTLNSSLRSAEQLTQSLNNNVAPEVLAAMKDVRNTLHNADNTLSSANKTFNAAQHSLAEDAPLQQDLKQTLQDLSRAANSLKVLTDYLEQHPESLIRGKSLNNQINHTDN
jgi:paraquat-inducible protein B